MKQIFLFTLIFFLPIIAICQIDIQKPFHDCGFAGSITIFDYNQNRWVLNDSTDSELEEVPASTFKIINLLIALETGVIKDENDMVKWVGTIDTAVYGYRPSTYKDMTVKEAFEVSAGWVFIELAKKVGKERYLEYLRACDYGNKEVSDEADFWNFGPLLISPKNQVNFLINAYESNLPFSKRNLAILKRVMVTEKTDDYTIYSKTGWGKRNGKDIGWWVGYVERNKNIYFFATRIVKNQNDKSKNFQACRIEITKQILKGLGFIE
ncbi:penicillin-binding transpeptidase domain-containing protein [Albibacterium indicum]|uniref:penicillin-binding transpeptidase domain-containing protein n=1 Tax=Albibacterium indicum TaxID=2292082 RepID=UPI000E51C48B|nr:penicillin-binding transpeptidase domain-containing protein [Pedobacter indicus]